MKEPNSSAAGCAAAIDHPGEYANLAQRRAAKYFRSMANVRT
jgi:hypothetical protein